MEDQNNTGSITEEDLQRLDDQIKEELKFWKSNPEQVIKPSMLQIKSVVEGLCELLVERGILTQNEILFYRQKHLLNTLQQVRKHQTQSKIVIPGINDPLRGKLN